MNGANSIEEHRVRRLKRAIWIYILLLMLEGALRKWLLPSLATPLLIVRDPVAVYILFEAARIRMLPSSPAFYSSFLIALIAIPVAVLVGHGDPYVALYGARPFLLHIPAMFVMARVLHHDDLVSIGKFMLFGALGMTVLIAVQFYSPQTAFVNRGTAGEDSSAGFSGALGYFRPPGTFSFTTGVAHFYSLVAAFVFYFWLSPSGISRKLLMATTVALLVALPLSVSRTLIFQCSIALVFASVSALVRPKLFRRGLMAILAIIVAVVLASPFEFFQKAVEVLQVRFTLASDAEGGLEGTLKDRFLGGLLSALVNGGDWPFWGMGIGMGTNVGAILLTGEAQFLIAEGEWQRLVAELGLFLGLLTISMRLLVAGRAAFRSAKALSRGDLLPWMLLSFGLIQISQGDWAQPTNLGFSVLAGALLLAALRQKHIPVKTLSQAPKSIRTIL